MVTQRAASLHADIGEVLLTPETIAQRVGELGRELAGDYADKRPLVVGTLKGAVVFMADLVRAIEPVPAGLSLEFIRASSYGAGTVSSGKVALGGTLAAADIAGRHVLLVEDIVDSGRTAVALVDHFKAAGAASVKMASLLSKPARRTCAYKPEYLCFEVEDKFVVGYGLDFDEQYRSLPYVGVLRPELYTGFE
ncbi:hypoxanthine phosphoribosyltransferase [Micractinium conductrix]|uniref:Hypoxanthine phosphoribosyltransferase n=1 Tax=Micractinium conductrix TaxID=554055 RepID=A0A2P6V8C8_9CHLO|nr:hypoxanthine phosphoribosyltransferase [Micractinium conductrix]|eukprot:PSC70333.1 hypoxanthine phosphoribosyltransferase [Micractinium conductrix]